MKLRGQHGYAMVTLLISLSIMAILLTVVMPVWKQMVQREKEAELVFRGEQYVHAIGLFQRKAGPGVYPPSIDVLVQQKYLRKKYKDPITGDDFVPLPAVQSGTPTPGQPTPAGGRQGAPPAGRGGTTAGAVQLGPAAGGVAGVASKSSDASIRIYKGRTRYNEWDFRFIAQTQTPGAGAQQPGPQRGGPQRGGPQPPGQQPGGRGTPPAGRGTPPPFPGGGGAVPPFPGAPPPFPGGRGR
jgi:type II secretory pathway pseudopilin PulG